MKQRCTNPKHPAYPYYGKRGITVCKRWLHSFDNLLADMGERPDGLTLERKKNHLGYSPGNCIWATRGAQARNRCTTKVTMKIARAIRKEVNAGAEKKATAKRYGVDQHTVHRIVLNKNWKEAYNGE
jgi:hypothetical protein